MSIDVRELLERGAPVPLRDVDVEAVTARGRQWRRRRTAAAAGAVVTVVVIAALPLSQLMFPPEEVLFEQPPNTAFIGDWVATEYESDGPVAVDEIDDTFQAMEIRAVQDGAYEVVIHDDAAAICSGRPAALTGTGRFAGPELVVPTLEMTCGDDTSPIDPTGSPLADAMRNYTLVRGVKTATLSDSLDLTWERPSATGDDDTQPAATGPLWPQSNMQELRDAQARADAGEFDYTWQIEPDMASIGGDAEIFTRFLTGELGWKKFRWDRHGHWSESTMSWGTAVNSSDVEFRADFVRCAPGERNPMYPNDPEGRACAPTLNRRAYETVSLTASRLLGDGADGIWVITGNQAHAENPLLQYKPLSDAVIDHAVRDHLNARVEGAWPDGFAPEAPLLLATSKGAEYERFDYEVVKGPTWPLGLVFVDVRLFANDGKTVVQQRFVLEEDTSGEVPQQGPFRPTQFRYSSHLGGTIENGAVVPEPYDSYGPGSFSADPRIWREYDSGPHGHGAITLIRNGDESQLLAVVGEPLTPAGTCDAGTEPESPEEFLRTLRSLPNLSVSEPQEARVGPIQAVQIDLRAADQRKGCVVPPGAIEQPHLGPAVIAPQPDQNHPDLRLWWGVDDDKQARVYVFDRQGPPDQIVAILVLAPTTEFQAVLEAAQPVLDSFTP